MSVEKLGYAAEKMASSSAGRQMAEGVGGALLTAGLAGAETLGPIVIAAAPVVATAAVGVAIGAGISKLLDL